MLECSCWSVFCFSFIPSLPPTLGTTGMGVDDVTNRDDYKALRESGDVSAKRGGEDGESFVDLLARASEAVRDVVHRYLRWIAGKGGRDDAVV